MEDSVADGNLHPWKVATMKRKAWAMSRASWQDSESVDVSAEVEQSPEPMEEKLPLAEEPGRIPNEKIAIWLKDCRTPLGASLDEQNNVPLKGVIKNGCSFEDDLSLGAEANHLHPSSSKGETPCFGMLAKDKRTQFHQKGRSMNSTGSGKSSTTYSSVSELLDLYEEDPEEILYNLGFGTDEPDIASKIPSRFFNSTSSAKGIDIKVYLGAQLQRMELENPNYALTSRFRQIEVLTTVANAFSSLYSQVSGQPVQEIGTTESETRETPLLKRRSSALNAAKILKKNISKHNLHGSPDSNSSPLPLATDKENPAVSTTEDQSGDPEQKNEQKLQKLFRKKDSPSLATVTEEGLSCLLDSSSNGNTVLNGDSPIEVNGNGVSEESGFIEPSVLRKHLSMSASGDLESSDEQKETVTSTPDKEPSAYLQNPRFAHLLLPQKDSFEMEEVQSNEGETIPGTRLASRGGNEQLLRTASQHSDSSGFAEDPSADGSTNYLKFQESSDSCDSETTVTSTAGELATPLAREQSVFQEMLGKEAFLPQSTIDGSNALETEADEAASEEVVPVFSVHQIPKPMERGTSETDEPHSTTDPEEPPCVLSASEKVWDALHRAQQKACPVSNESRMRSPSVRVKSRDLLWEKDRYPLRRASSLPSSLLSPTRVVSSVKINLHPGSRARCTPPSFTYRYTPEEQEEPLAEEEEQPQCKSTLIINTPPVKTEQTVFPRDIEEEVHSKIPPYPLQMPQHMTQSMCSLHSTPSDWHSRPLCEHMRSWSTCSVPNVPPYSTCGSSYSFSSCPYPPSSCPYPRHSRPPSTTEMQLRRVLHDIRNTVQNLSQYSTLRGEDLSTTSMFNSQRSILPLYENTFQELQVMRKSLSVFRNQMMDLELSMMRQQSMVYQHLTDEERQEAQQLQHLRNAVRQELQELELQLEDRLLSLEDQLHASHHTNLYHPPMGLHGTHSMDSLSCNSPMNVMEPVNELLREQLYLKSELRYEEPGGDDGSSAAPSVVSEHSSGSASPIRTQRNLGTNRRPQTPELSSLQREGRYRASVVLTPSPPMRPVVKKSLQAEQEEDSKSVEECLGDDLSLPSTLSEEGGRRVGTTSPQMKQLIKEIKDSIADEIRQEIVNELLAAVSPRRSPAMKREHT
ncbi:protein ITPRID2 isoform X1 [Lepisosteus oculatus]|uniref:protein ITPRID2 isoform X1 n=1 Tax=Lepisosteus oculatus TaxID=7918 RepID=UPI00073FB9BE|nr:PREDICTED: sperm-specific antigen 2 isoform X1 [Lepisosteus oculatus]XP_015214499.1 PREDICTED: sperm-specific antigen 2 isoform X1 [Lepisosteus oculatus]